MINKNISEITEKLLHDPDFIIRCINPEKDADIQWANWLEEHPSEREAAEQARIILRSARFNEYAIPSDKSKALFARIERNAQQNKQKKSLFLFYYLTACAVLTLVVISTWKLWQPMNPSDTLNAYSTVKPDSIRTEVTLIMDNSEIVEVENNTLITYKSGNIIKNQQEKQTILRKTNKKQDKTEMNTLVVPRGRRSSLVLADGSKVWVNSGSKLRFPTLFDSQERIIEVEGEIYIEVVKKSSPFYVKTNGFTVEVLGTKFNISAYSDEDAHSVVLVEGSVQVDMKAHEEVHLSPNQMLTIASGSNSIQEVDVKEHILWKDGMFQFSNEPMETIFRRLSRYYNIPVKYTPAVAKRRSSGKLVLFDNIEQVMKTFSMLYDINYKMEGDTLLIE